jgi:hypothetical protein
MIRDVLDAVIGDDCASRVDSGELSSASRVDPDTDPADLLDADDREEIEEFVADVRREARRQQRGGRR